jgi:O-methyltransferase
MRMDNAVIHALAARNPEMCDVDRLVNLYWALSSVLVTEVQGAIMELGCNAGKTSVFRQMIIDHFAPQRALHLYDSFEGLPARGVDDPYLHAGELKAARGDVEREFAHWGLTRPHIHEGWFDQTLTSFCPSPIAFAYVDGDYYASIFTSLEWIYPRLSRHGIIIVDDYCDPARNSRAWDRLPGVKKACDDFLAGKPERVSVLVGSGDLALGLLRKQ